PQDRCIHQLFEAQVQHTPEAIAVVFENEHLTYRDLNRRANQLAHHLQKLGVGPDVLVGICVERSLDMLVGLLGILKAGGAYLPLDPAYPKARLAFMLEDTRAALLVTQAGLVERIPASTARVVRLDADWPAIAREPETAPPSLLQPQHPAYVIYTSGSTGTPKGVVLDHRSASEFLNWAHHAFSEDARAGVIASTSLSFDLSVFEVFLPLCFGGRVLIAADPVHL